TADPRHLRGIEVAHDGLRSFEIVALLEKAPDKALHVCRSPRVRIAVEQLQIDGRKMMIRVRIELALVLRLRAYSHKLAVDIRVRLGAMQAVASVVELLE